MFSIHDALPIVFNLGCCIHGIVGKVYVPLLLDPVMRARIKAVWQELVDALTSAFCHRPRESSFVDCGLSIRFSVVQTCAGQADLTWTTAEVAASSWQEDFVQPPRVQHFPWSGSVSQTQCWVFLRRKTRSPKPTVSCTPEI